MSDHSSYIDLGWYSSDTGDGTWNEFLRLAPGRSNYIDLSRSEGSLSVDANYIALPVFTESKKDGNILKGVTARHEKECINFLQD